MFFSVSTYYISLIDFQANFRKYVTNWPLEQNQTGAFYIILVNVNLKNSPNINVIKYHEPYISLWFMAKHKKHIEPYPNNNYGQLLTLNNKINHKITCRMIIQLLFSCSWICGIKEFLMWFLCQSLKEKTKKEHNKYTNNYRKAKRERSTNSPGLKPVRMR